MNDAKIFFTDTQGESVVVSCVFVHAFCLENFIQLCPLGSFPKMNVGGIGDITHF